MAAEEDIPAQLSELASCLEGPRPERVSRLSSATKKGVYRLHWPGGRSLIAYVWHPTQDFWPVQSDVVALDTFLADGQGMHAFVVANRVLESLQVPTPRLLLSDDSHQVCVGEVALVEDASGGALGEHLSGADAPRLIGDLGEALSRLHAQSSDRIGTLVSSSRVVGTCEDLVHERAVRDLEHASADLPELKALQTAVGERLLELRSRVRPRASFGLIHGELGPEHVLLGHDGSLRLIDIEGLMHFDVEWEHVFLEIRYGRHYGELRRRATALDEDRLSLYRLAMYLSLAAGPMRLLRGEFPDRAGMLSIVEANVRRVIASLPG